MTNTPEELESLMPQSHENTVNTGYSSSIESHGYPITAGAFKLILLFSHLIGILVIVLTILWTNKYLGGYGWAIPSTEFNYHPLFLIIGMVYLYGNSIISYRLFPSLDKPKLKLIHSILHAACLVFTATGLYAVIDFHQRAHIVNFYSLHSWIGIFTATIYFFQWIGSLYAFLYPGIQPTYRAIALPFHVRGGLIIFAISVVTCLTGLTEKIMFSLTVNGTSTYSQLPPAAFYANFIGVFIILYAILIGYLVTESAFARKPTTGESKISSISLSTSRNR
ncbi:lysosomal membrane ascorbate-dependent ferrireductase CYB561A3-like isoform X2 [Panonychus citri]|uniref:lysosomal membrane ascorbate-dependent ferrireductase CYB561A3-like isoform X2 n=1 Tax=Panonychus citri TaxID=50023 RepID=UPI0023073647|nr:lysosomal membrane ascorbate-dependent ferrireductase CYB561A3-like isoform X2 [Panonychus citri]